MIRIATEKDVPEMLSIYTPYIVSTTYTFEYDVPSEAEFLQRFRDITQQFPWIVWEEDGRILGYAYGSAPFARAAYRWCAEDSVYLLPEAQGRGIGRKLCTVLEKIFIFQGYRQAYALITSENTRSLEFHRKMGYEIVAKFENSGYKFGRWLDVTWMKKELKFGFFPSDFPGSWAAIIQDDKNLSNILDILSLS